ncbi:hypothetical protein SAMN05428987_3688 [Paenibacillus sp. CF095]|nr:hypothetical protein SAMN05428987_3688 [Paenibacillus sp. CF095]
MEGFFFCLFEQFDIKVDKKGHPLPGQCCSTFRLRVANVLFLQQVLDIFFNLVRCCFGSITFNYLSVLIHKKFGEIPFDCFGAEQARSFCAKVLEERVSA